MRKDLEENMRKAGFDPNRGAEEIRAYQLWHGRQRQKKLLGKTVREKTVISGKPNEIKEPKTVFPSYLPSIAKPSFSKQEESRDTGVRAREGGELVLFPGMAASRRFEDGRVSVVPANAFAQFCAIYPHIPNIEDAEWAFEAALERATFQEIMAGAERYANWLAASGSYPTAAHNWLVKGCWAAKLAIAKPRIQDLEKLEDAYVRYTPVETVLERDRANGGNQLERLLARRQS